LYSDWNLILIQEVQIILI